MIFFFHPSNPSKAKTETEAGNQIQWNWITLSGPDSKDFLHRLTTVNVKSLQVGQGSRGCFLNPQGKIRAYFTLWNYGLNEYAFEFDAGSSGRWKTDLLALIDQYTFGEKITVLDPTPGLDSCWLFLEGTSLAETPIGSLGTDETCALPEEIRISNHGIFQNGRQWLTAWGSPARLSEWLKVSFPDAKALDFSELETWRIEALQPRVDKEITDSAMPLEIGLQKTIAENKGCYPGQEVIEKIIARGSPPRRLVRIEGEGTPPLSGDRIFNLADEPAEVGQVTSVIEKDRKFIALGLLRKIHAKEGLQVRFEEKQGSSGTIVKVADYH